MREQLAHLLRRVELPAGLARARRVHLHEVLIRVAERVDGVVFEPAQLEVTDRVEQLDELLVAPGHRVAELLAVHVEIVEEALDVVFAVGSDGRALDVAEHAFERLVEVLVTARAAADALEQLTGQDVEALLGHRLGTAELGIGVGEVGVVEVGAPRRTLLCVQVGGEILGDEPVEEDAEHVGLEVPAIHGPAQIVRDAPDRLVELGALRFLGAGSHVGHPTA